jgi:voltage-gated sodium channel
MDCFNIMNFSRLRKLGKGVRDAPIRADLRDFFASLGWEKFIMAVIIVNAITLGLETSPWVMGRYGGLLSGLNELVLAIFVVEITLRIYAHGRDFWTRPWSLFDFAVVAITILPTTGDFSVVRALRVLRVLRLVSIVPSMRRVVSGLLTALPGMGSIMALLALLLYVFSVMATNLYGRHFPELFGTLGASAFTLFQVMTLEGWAGNVVRPVMKIHPWAWIYFTIFILTTSFAVLNLFIGIIVDAMQSVQEEERKQEHEQEMADLETILRELRELRGDITSLEDERKKPG